MPRRISVKDRLIEGAQHWGHPQVPLWINVGIGLGFVSIFDVGIVIQRQLPVAYFGILLAAFCLMIAIPYLSVVIAMRYGEWVGDEVGSFWCGLAAGVVAFGASMFMIGLPCGDIPVVGPVLEWMIGGGGPFPSH